MQEDQLFVMLMLHKCFFVSYQSDAARCSPTNTAEEMPEQEMSEHMDAEGMLSCFHFIFK